MDKQAFIADYISRNTPARNGLRSRLAAANAVSPEELQAKAEAAWAAYSAPAAVLTRALEAKGGNFWSSDDYSKKRVYFNMSVALDYATVYCNVLTGNWFDQSGKQLSAEDAAVTQRKLGL